MDEKSAKLELLYDGMYYDVTNWIKKHPGGNIIKLYTQTGEDSTIAVQQFHQRSTNRVMSIMKSLPHREINENDYSEMNSVKLERNKALTKDFMQLYQQFQKEGLFKPSPWHVFLRNAELIFLFTVAFYCYHLQSPTILTRSIAFISASLGVGRTGFIVHESGHHSLTGNPDIDRFVCAVYYGLIHGFSSSYWINQHSRHHAMPQHIKHDVDLRTLPLIAFNKKAVENPKDGKGFFVQNQKWLFILCDSILVTLLWKFYLHPRYCIRKGKYQELALMSLHYVLMGNFGLINYMLIMWCSSVYLLGNFTLNHSHLPVTEEPTHWVEYSLTHTANIRSSTFGWVDYWMGNLNYQIEHHLFPTMPQYKNKLCRDRVKALAIKHNLPYQLYSYGEAVMKSFDNLSTVSKELAMN